MVPLEVEVTSAASLFSPGGFVDFGIGGSMDGTKTVPLYVQNPLKKLLRVQSITSTSPILTVDMKDIKIPADRGKGDQIVRIANLTIDCGCFFLFVDCCFMFLIFCRVESV